MNGSFSGQRNWLVNVAMVVMQALFSSERFTMTTFTYCAEWNDGIVKSCFWFSEFDTFPLLWAYVSFLWGWQWVIDPTNGRVTRETKLKLQYDHIENSLSRISFAIYLSAWQRPRSTSSQSNFVGSRKPMWGCSPFRLSAYSLKSFREFLLLLICFPDSFCCDDSNTSPSDEKPL